MSREANVLATLRKPTAQTETAELGRIFADHHARIYRAAYRITGNTTDAEDVLQNVFLRLARQDGSGGGASDGPDLGPAPAANLEGYLYRAAINSALDLCRKRRLQPALTADLEPLPEPAAGGPRPGEELELRGWLRRALAALSPRQAEMFVLRYLEGYDNREIAQLMQTSQAVVAVSLFRVRSRLKKSMRALAGGAR
jgi:RNA polymerase sigma factor (sigma-70 family)